MLEFVLEKFIALLGPIATLNKEKRELKDNALTAISHALVKTRVYYRDLENGGMRDMNVEARLVEYWAAAAIPLRHIDEELALICDLKAEYWVNPEGWSEEQLGPIGIRLGDVANAYRRLAMPSFSKAGRATRIQTDN